MRIAPVIAVLLYSAACADPEDPDAGPGDLGFADSGPGDAGVRPDATLDSGPGDQGLDPDATFDDAAVDGGPDAAVFSLTLTTSSTIVTDSTPVLLTASPMDGTPTVVDFYEGNVLLGSASSPQPFTFQVDFDSTMNGLHTFHAEANSGAERARSNDVIVEVRIDTGLYVDPVGGDDTNPGTLAAPFQTIRHAITLAEAGDTIWLLDGTYDEANQGASFGTYCPGPVFPADVDLRALNPNSVRLEGINGCAFTFDGSSTIDGILFYGYQQALLFVTGSSTVSGSRFDDCGMAMYLRDDAEVTWYGTIESSVTDIQNTSFGVPGATADYDSRLTVRGALFEGITTFNIGVLFVRGNGTLIVENSTFRDINRPAFRVYDNAHAIVRDTTFERVGGTGLGAENATIIIGGQNTQQPNDTGVVLERCTMTNNNRHGIAFSYYGNIATHLVVSLIDSRIQDGLGTALLSNALTIADPGLDVEVTLINTTLLGGVRGLYSLAGTVDIQGGEISGMTSYGIEVINGLPANSLRVRGTTFDGNGDDAIRIASPSTILDLGTMIDPGNNLMSAIPANAAAVNLAAAISGSAVGNTWMANEQGADAAGRYPAGTTGTGPVNGRNYELVAGSTLLIQP